MDILTKGLAGLPYRRKAAGFTQEGLAAALGVNRPALAMWERGRSWPSAGLLPKLADLLLCSIDDLYKEPTPEQLAELGGDGLHASVVKIYGGGEVIEDCTPEGEVLP